MLEFLSSIFKPAVELIDNLHTSDEEKLNIKAQMLTIEAQAQAKIIAYEQQLMNQRAEVIQSEATGQSWLQRNWRPITMLTFLSLVVCDSFAWLPNPLAEEMWLVIQIGLGGYVVGRSAEKIGIQSLKTLKKPTS